MKSTVPRLILGIVGLLVFLIADFTDTLAVTSTPRATSTPRITSTPRQTSTPRPSSTTGLTSTPRPSSTLRPTPTPTVFIPPDMRVESGGLSFTGKNLKAGDKTTLKAVIHNIGQGKATKVNVVFSVDAKKVYEKTISSIAKNGKSTVSYSYRIPESVSGSMAFNAAVDPGTTIPESSENNNSAAIQIPVSAASINLILDSFKPLPSKPKPGQKISWQFKVRNAGNVKANGITVALLANKDTDLPTSTITIGSLNPNATSTKTIPWTVPVNLSPALEYPVRGVVDVEGKIPEVNELDNTKVSLLNLTVPDISVEPGQYFAPTGKLYPVSFQQIWVRVKNDTVVAVPAAKVGVYYALNSVSGTRIKLMDTTVTLPKKANVEHMFDQVMLPNSIPVGTSVYFFVVVDSEKGIPESNETNNEVVFQRTIVDRPPQAQAPYMYITVHDEDGNTKNGVTVQFSDTNNPSGNRTKITGSDVLSQNAKGIVVFDALPDTGRFTVTVSASGYRTQTETVQYDKNNEDSRYRSYNLDTRAVLTGTVKNQSGSPLSYVSVKIDGTGLEAVTDAAGKYGFMLNGGTYSIRFIKPGFARITEQSINVAPLATVTVDKTMVPTTTAYVSGMVTDDEGNGLSNVDIHVNGTMIGTTATDGHFTFANMSAGNKTFKFRRPNFVETEFTQFIEAGGEYLLSFVMYKPSTDTHVERGTQIVSWHQHEGTPANGFFIPEYNVDVWWGLARVKMGLDFTKTGDGAKLTKLVIHNHGQEWECNKVEGEGDIETSAIDIPITIAAGSCSGKKTQVDVYKVAIESDGVEVWSDTGFWTSASDPVNTGTRVSNLNNLQVAWNNSFKVKMWVRVQKRAVVGTDGDGAGALYGYHMDKKLITWYPQKPPTTVISTSWGQVGNYLLGILDNPVTAITSFTDLFTVEQFNTFTMEEVLPANFPGNPTGS